MCVKKECYLVSLFGFSTSNKMFSSLMASSGLMIECSRAKIKKICIANYEDKNVLKYDILQYISKTFFFMHGALNSYVSLYNSPNQWFCP